jgi:hypothetical protein
MEITFFSHRIKPGLGVDLVKGSGPGSHGLNLVNLKKYKKNI